MYEKYSTDAIVLESRTQSEADKYFTLYTREFGLIRGRGSAVRSEKSKMRYALQLFSLSSVSLVKGKTGWRMAGAMARANAVGNNVAAMQAFGRIAKLLLRLLHGEEKNEYLFDAVVGARAELFTGSEGVDVECIELLCVIRILYALGYVAPNATTRPFIDNAQYESGQLASVALYKTAALGLVNSALAATNL